MIGVPTTRIGEFLESCPYHQLGQDRFRIEPITVVQSGPDPERFVRQRGLPHRHFLLLG